MILHVFALIAGLVLLLLSADRFVEGAVCVARTYRIPPLVIGMVIVGFGTSFPELLVSALASIQGSGGLALGNAYGSNIANIGLILGVTAMVLPIEVHSGVLKRELPILIVLTGLTCVLLLDWHLNRLEAGLLLVLFGGLVFWTLLQARKHPGDALAEDTEKENLNNNLTLTQGWVRLSVGLLVLLASSRVLVWSASSIARTLGLSEMLIGLTIVALGTSLPEFASSLSAARKGEPDIVLGNILGSNLFNTLAVVGLSGLIRPLQAESVLVSRDLPVMAVFSLSLFVFGYGFKGRRGHINRMEGTLLAAGYLGYLLWLALPLLR